MPRYDRDYRYRRDMARTRPGGRRDYRYRSRDGRGEWEADIRGEYERDGRRGVKYTGRYGIGGSRYYGRDRAAYPDYDMRGRRDYRHEDYDYDEDDYYRDGRDYADGEDMRLTDEEMTEWKHALKNSDGTRGEHFGKDKILDIARRLNMTFDDYTEKDLCMTANMLYSDVGQAFKAYIPIDKEVVAYTKAARLWLEDEDADMRGSEKLAEYFYTFVEPTLDD